MAPATLTAADDARYGSRPVTPGDSAPLANPDVNLWHGHAKTWTGPFIAFCEVNDITRDEAAAILAHLESHDEFKGGGGAQPVYILSIAAPMRTQTAHERCGLRRALPCDNFRPPVGEAHPDHHDPANYVAAMFTVACEPAVNVEAVAGILPGVRAEAEAATLSFLSGVR